MSHPFFFFQHLKEIEFDSKSGSKDRPLIIKLKSENKDSVQYGCETLRKLKKLSTMNSTRRFPMNSWIHLDILTLLQRVR